MNFGRSVILKYIVMAAWNHKMLKYCEKFLSFFWKTIRYGKIFKILFRKFSLRHRSTLLCSNFVKFVPREIGEIVRYLHDQTKKFRLPLKLSLLRRSRPKSATASSQQCTQSACSRFHPNRFSFGGVIAGMRELLQIAPWSKSNIRRKPIFERNNNVLSQKNANFHRQTDYCYVCVL